MTQRRYFKIKNTSFPLSELIEIGSPDLYYSVQQALQNEGVLLIDLYTGDTIEGQVNISSIGLIAGQKAHKPKRQTGFIQSNLPGALQFEKRDLDAILTFDQNAQKQGDPLYLLIQVVDHDEMPFWSQVAIVVAKKFIVKENGVRLPEIFFGVTSLSRSNGINASARNAALHKIRGYSLDGVDSISDMAIPPDNIEFYEEEGGDFEFKKGLKRK